MIIQRHSFILLAAKLIPHGIYRSTEQHAKMNPGVYLAKQQQQQQQLPVWSHLCGVWGGPHVGSLTLVSITTLLNLSLKKKKQGNKVSFTSPVSNNPLKTKHCKQEHRIITHKHIKLGIISHNLDMTHPRRHVPKECSHTSIPNQNVHQAVTLPLPTWFIVSMTMQEWG